MKVLSEEQVQDSKVSELKNNLAKLESESSQYENHIKNFQQDIQKHKDSFTKSTNQGKKNLLDQINVTLSNVTEISVKLSALKGDLESEKGGLESQLDKLLSQLQKGISQIQDQVNSLSTKQEEDISRLYQQMAGKVNTGLNNIYSQQHKEIDDFQTKISQKLTEIQRGIMSTVERESANLAEMSEGISSSFLSSLNEFKDTMRQLSDAKEAEIDSFFAKTVRESVARLEIAKEDLLAGIDGLKTRLDEHLVKQKSIFDESQKQVLLVIDDGKQDVKARIDKSIDRYYDEWLKYQGEQSQTMTNIKENVFDTFTGALKTNQELQMRLTGEFENNLKNGFRQLEEQILSSLSRISSDFDTKRERTAETLTKAFNSWSTSVDSSFSQFGSRTKKKLEETTRDLNVSLMDFFDKSQTSLSETLAQHSGTLGELQDSISDLFKTIQEGQEKNIETTLVDMRAALNTKQSELIMTVSSIEPAADGAIEASKDGIETKNDEFKRSSTAAFDDLRKQIRTIEQDGTLAIQNIVSVTHDKLDEGVKTSGESTKALVLGLEDEHKDAVRSYRTNTVQKLDSHQSTLDSYRGTLKDKFSEFFADNQKISDHYTGQLRLDREQLDEERRKVDVNFEEAQNNIESSISNLTSSVGTNTKNSLAAAKEITKATKNIVKALR